MKFYLAARYERHPGMRGVAAWLIGIGHTVTSRWISGAHGLEGTVGGESQHNARMAKEDLSDIIAADCLIFFAEDPMVGVVRGGRHVEFGYALALGKRVIVVDYRENIFHWLPQVEFYSSWPDALHKLLTEQAEAAKGTKDVANV